MQPEDAAVDCDGEASFLCVQWDHFCLSKADEAEINPSRYFLNLEQESRGQFFFFPCFKLQIFPGRNAGPDKLKDKLNKVGNLCRRASETWRSHSNVTDIGVK